MRRLRTWEIGTVVHWRSNSLMVLLAKIRRKDLVSGPIAATALLSSWRGLLQALTRVFDNFLRYA